MKILELLIKTLLVFLGVLISFVCSAQNQSIEMKDSTSLQPYIILRGETILVGYDTARILNKKIFKLFQDNYTRVKNNNSSVEKLEEAYDRLILAQEDLLNEREQSYQQIKLHFDTLMNISKNFVDRTSTNVSEIDLSLASATDKLNKVNLLIDSSLDKLKIQNNKKIKFGIGGFTLGVVVSTLIILIAK